MKLWTVWGFSILLYLSLGSSAGNSGGNGGDKTGLHFTESAQTAQQWIQSHNELSWVQELNEKFNPSNLSDTFLKSIQNTKIEVVEEKLFLDNKEKIAINFPEKELIKLNHSLWEASSKADQIAIAAHEHFGIIGVDDSNYRYSTEILKNFNREKTISDLAVIAGMPNMSAGKIEEIVDQNIIINPELPDRAMTTKMYSILKLQNVKSVANLQIISQLGSSSIEMLIKGLDLSSKISPIVLSPLGPMNKVACEVMARHKKTVFILPAGNDSSFMNPPTDCLEKNIIFVAYLNKEKTDLAAQSNKGESISIAAPGYDIPAFDEKGQAYMASGGSAAISFLASALVQYSIKYPALVGAGLAQSFLDEETVELPALEGKVRNRKAWLK